MGIASLLDQPPIWREGLVGLEAAALVRSPVFRGEGIARADGQPVLLIPGFLAGDDSLGLMTTWLRRTGHHTRRAGIRVNADCSGAALERIERRLEDLAERRGRVAIIGQSRGGCFAKALAVRRPDLVAGIVTLGSPVLDPLAIHPLVRLQVLAVGTLGTLGAPRLFRRACLSGECCAGFAEELAGRPDPDVGYVAIYSRRDGVVDWRACLDPAAEQHLEVTTSHCGMSLDANAYRATAGALERFRVSERGAARQAPALRRAA